MTREQANLLIAELGGQLGLADLALSGTGSVTLAVDGSMMLAIRHDPDTGDIELSSALDAVTPSPARLARALSASFCWAEADGAVFGLDRMSGQLVLGRHCPGQSLDLAGLMTALDSLAKHTQAWTKILGDIAEEEAPSAVRPPPMPREPIQTA
jgi:hypothetical protein